jgi:hypothetical protein
MTQEVKLFVSHLRLTIATSALVALLAIGAPAATAKTTTTDDGTYVCNQATPTSQGGDLNATDAPTGSPSERYRENLHAKPGNGGGLDRAADRSPALSHCGGTSNDGGGGGGDPIT